MGFPPSIKEQELIASARHCCVCHRYAGVNIEVHHIQQEADGGSNTFENAIALCFDCHSFAGHYNSRHPKGTKYSKSELKKAKANWHNLVAQNSIKPTGLDDKILCKYLICKDYESFNSILKGELDSIPISSPLLAQTPQGKLIEKILDQNESSYQTIYSFSIEYKSEEDYLTQNPDSIRVESGGIFHYTRIPKKEEFLERYDELNGLIRSYLDRNIPIEYFASAEATFNECGGDYETVSEIFSVKPIWCVFLVIENISNKPVHFQELDSRIHKNGEYVGTPDSINELDNFRFKLPSVGVKPNQNIIFPLGLILGEHDSISKETVHIDQFDSPTMEYVLSLSLQDNSRQEDRFNIGSFSYPQLIKYQFENQELQQKVHEIDYSRLYCIDKHWLIGSCPHLMFIQKDKSLDYIGELFNKAYPIIEVREFLVPKGTQGILIVELEEEITFIEHLKVNKKFVFKNKKLSKGEQLSLVVQEGSLVEVKGYYLPINETSQFSDACFQQNRIVKRYMKKYITNTKTNMRTELFGKEMQAGSNSGSSNLGAYSF